LHEYITTKDNLPRRGVVHWSSLMCLVVVGKMNILIIWYWIVVFSKHLDTCYTPTDDLFCSFDWMCTHAV